MKAISLLLLCLTFCFLGAKAQTVGTSGTVSFDLGNITTQVANVEKNALKFLLDHHYIGIRASAQCLNLISNTSAGTDSSNNELSSTVKGLCNYISLVQRAEFDIFRDLLEGYYNISYEVPALGIATAENVAQNLTQSLQFWKQELENLTELAGAEFEMKLLRFLVVHQSSGILGATACAQSAFHKELLDLCLSEISSLSTQISQVRAFLCGKFDICQLELTPDEVSVSLNAFNDVTLGVGVISFGGIEVTTIGTETVLETATAIGTETAIGSQTAIGTAVTQATVPL